MGRFKCDTCGKVCTTKAGLQVHINTHTGARPYPCTECGKSFAQRPTLYTHKRIHTGEKPHHCDDCNQDFRDLSTYRRHCRTHTGEKPYKCQVCKRRFSQSGNLQRHMNSFHSQHWSPLSFGYWCNELRKSVIQNLLCSRSDPANWNKLPKELHDSENHCKFFPGLSSGTLRKITGVPKQTQRIFVHTFISSTAYMTQSRMYNKRFVKNKSFSAWITNHHCF